MFAGPRFEARYGPIGGLLDEDAWLVAFGIWVSAWDDCVLMGREGADDAGV